MNQVLETLFFSFYFCSLGYQVASTLRNECFLKPLKASYLFSEYSEWGKKNFDK